jgi:hypothetical protein
MPAGAFFTLAYYGPATGSLFGELPATSIVATPKGYLRGAVTAQGVADAPVFRPIRLVNRPLSAVGEGVLLAATPKGKARFALTVDVNRLTQDDVTGAVLDTVIEGDLTMRQVLRLLTAYAAGNATGLTGSAVTFRSVDGSKTRIGGTVTGGNRTITVLDGE